MTNTGEPDPSLTAWSCPLDVYPQWTPKTPTQALSRHPPILGLATLCAPTIRLQRSTPAPLSVPWTTNSYLGTCRPTTRRPVRGDGSGLRTM